jgi:hypothetical protein
MEEPNSFTHTNCYNDSQREEEKLNSVPFGRSKYVKVFAAQRHLGILCEENSNWQLKKLQVETSV